MSASACGPNRCALRRFDGHGTSTYRPTVGTREFDGALQRMMAERARQDKGIFTAQRQEPQEQPQQPQPNQNIQVCPK